jgi:hypothetical protein
MSLKAALICCLAFWLVLGSFQSAPSGALSTISKQFQAEYIESSWLDGLKRASQATSDTGPAVISSSPPCLADGGVSAPGGSCLVPSVIPSLGTLDTRHKILLI